MSSISSTSTKVSSFSDDSTLFASSAYDSDAENPAAKVARIKEERFIFKEGSHSATSDEDASCKSIVSQSYMDQETDHHFAAAAAEEVSYLEPLNHPGYNTPVGDEDLYYDDRVIHTNRTIENIGRTLVRELPFMTQGRQLALCQELRQQLLNERNRLAGSNEDNLFAQSRPETGPEFDFDSDSETEETSETQETIETQAAQAPENEQEGSDSDSLKEWEETSSVTPIEEDWAEIRPFDANANERLTPVTDLIRWDLHRRGRQDLLPA